MSNEWWKEEDGHQIWRGDRVLIMRRGAELPVDRCVRCNQPAVGVPVRISLSCAKESVPGYLPKPLKAVAQTAELFTRGHAVIYIGLCSLHRARRRRFGALLCLCLLTAAVCFIGAIISKRDWLWIPCIILPIIAAVLAELPLRVVEALMITDDTIVLGGVAPAYLRRFPIAEEDKLDGSRPHQPE
jgi:hypothetical protein